MVHSIGRSNRGFMLLALSLVYLVAIGLRTRAKILRSVWNPVGTNISEIFLPIQSSVPYAADSIEELSRLSFIHIFASSRKPIWLGILSVASLDSRKRGRFQICGRVFIFATSWIKWRRFVRSSQCNLASHRNAKRHRSSEVSRLHVHFNRNTPFAIHPFYSVWDYDRPINHYFLRYVVSDKRALLVSFVSVPDHGDHRDCKNGRIPLICTVGFLCAFVLIYFGGFGHIAYPCDY